MKIGHDEEPIVEGAEENAKAETEFQSPIKEESRRDASRINVDQQTNNLDYNKSSFKLDNKENATLADKIKTEIFIFWYHCYAILYRRYVLQL